MHKFHLEDHKNESYKTKHECEVVISGDLNFVLEIIIKLAHEL